VIFDEKKGFGISRAKVSFCLHKDPLLESSRKPKALDVHQKIYKDFPKKYNFLRKVNDFHFSRSKLYSPTN